MTEPKKLVHPIAFLVLYLPFGASAGFGSVPLAYQLHAHGVSVPSLAIFLSMNLLPNTWKVLWSPLIDTTLSARKWYAIGVGITALTFLVMAFAPLKAESMPLLDALAFVLGLASSVAAMGAERFMAFGTSEEQKGRAGGWSQAGNLGGSGLGGGLGLVLVTHTHLQWSAGVLLAVLSLACILMAFRLTDPPRVGEAKPYLTSLKEAGRDVFALATRRIGLLALLICLLPMGTGAAGNLWSVIAGDWRAGADEIALVAGALSGVLTIVGALGAGYICDRMDRKGAYALFGVLGGLAAVILALAPRTPTSFLLFTSLYNLMTGASFAAFGALTLEAIGQGAAATKYNLIASVANVPILLTTLADGRAQQAFGSGGMLLTEAAMAIGAAGLYLAVARLTRGWSWQGARRLAGLAPAAGG